MLAFFFMNDFQSYSLFSETEYFSFSLCRKYIVLYRPFSTNLLLNQKFPILYLYRISMVVFTWVDTLFS